MTLFLAITLSLIHPLPAIQVRQPIQPAIIKPRVAKAKTPTIIPLASVYLQNGGGLSYKDKFVEAIKARNLAHLKAVARAERLAKEKLARSLAKTQAPVLRPIVYHPVSYSANTYSYGYCTWYVKNRRPDIPNTWHDASQWYGYALAQGWPRGTVPRVGAVAWFKNYGHVAIVSAIGNGTVTVDEMNYNGLGVVDSRVVSSSELEFIY